MINEPLYNTHNSLLYKMSKALFSHIGADILHHPEKNNGHELISDKHNTDENQNTIKGYIKASNMVTRENKLIETVLARPHHIRWDKQTKVVCLNKDKANCDPGFMYKVKIVEKSSGVEIYTLVTDVSKNGIAHSKLHRGDWILSVGGAPIANQDMAKTIKLRITDDPQNEVRLVIQRPHEIVGKHTQSETTKQQPFLDEEKVSGENYQSSQVTIPETRGLPSQDAVSPSYDSKVQTKNKDFPLKNKIYRKGHRKTHSDTSEIVRRQSEFDPEFQVTKRKVRRRLSEKRRSCPSCGSCFSLTVLGHDMRKIITDTIKTVSSEKLAQILSLRLFVTGYQSRDVVNLLASNNLTPQKQCKVFKQYNVKIDSDAELYPSNGRNCEMMIARRIAAELMKCNSFRNDIENVIRYLKDSEAVVCGVECKDIAVCLENLGSDSSSSKQYCELNILATEEHSLKDTALHVLYTKHSMHFVSFMLEEIITDQQGCLERLDRQMAQITTYAGNDTPIGILGISSTGDVCPIQSEIGLLLQEHFSKDFDNNLLYNKVTNFPLFILNMKSGLDQSNAMHAIVSLIKDHVFRQQPYSMRGPICRRLVLNARQDKLKCMTMSRLHTNIEEMFDQVTSLEVDEIIKYLHDSGELICERFLSINTCSTFNKTITDMFVLLDPGFLIHCIDILTDIPSKFEQTPGSRQQWSRLQTTSITGVAFLKDLLTDVSDCIEIIAFMELMNLVITHKTDAATTDGMRQKLYMVPSFLPATPTEALLYKYKGSDNCLYIDCHSFLSTSLFLYIVQSVSSHGNKVRGEVMIDSVMSCHVRMDGLEFVMIRDSPRSLIAVHFIESINHPEALKVLHSLMSQCLPAKPKITYHIGPMCPLLNQCSRRHGGHVVDISEESVYCGTEDISNINSIRKWMLYSPVVKDVEKRRQSAVSMSTPLLQLPYALFSIVICRTLNDPIPGRDWRGIADCIGKTFQELKYYERERYPCEALLHDWGTTETATLGDLMKVISTPDMDRKDLQQDILQWIAKFSDEP